MTKVGIVLVTYNSANDIKRLLESILIQDYSDLVLYVVDNNSQDATLKIVRNYLTKMQICIIPCKVNKGFAGGNNIGIIKALDDGCDLIFILNPDIELEAGCITVLSKRIMADGNIGVVGPVVLYGYTEGNIIQGLGSFANFRSQKKSSTYSNQPLSERIPAEHYVDYVLGGAMMIKSSILRLTGLFEEDYFMYNDEIDIAYRIKKAGFQTLAISRAVVRHFHDFDPRNKKGNNLMYYYIVRNRYLYFLKYQLYTNLSLSLLEEVISFPLKINWALRRMKNIKILKYYYCGLFDGLRGKKGNSNINFN